MSEVDWNWTTVAVNAAIVTAIIAGVLYLSDGAINLAEFAAVEAVMVLGIFFRWRRRRRIS